jgi:CelD/BcsL family acetyltransferase involved in cellulose biosynthesis
MPLAFEAFPITGPAAWQSHTGDWRRFLGEDGIEAGIYCDPLFIERTMSFADGRSIVLVTGADERGLCCVLPFRFQLERSPVRLGPYTVGSVAARVLRLADFEFAVRGGCDRMGILRTVMPLARGFARADLVHVDNAPAYEAAEAGDGAPGWSQQNRQTTYVVKNQADYGSYWDSLGSRVRVELKRRTKKLKEKCHDGVLLKKYTQADEMAELHAHLTAVWSRSWHAGAGGSDPLGLDLPALEHLAAEGWVRSYVLLAEDRPIAFLWGYQYRGKYYYDSIAFDAGWGEYAPGTVLNHLALAEIFGVDPPRELDFGFGYNKYKEHLGSHPEDRSRIWVPLTWRGRAALAGASLGERLGTFGRELSKRAGLYTWLRKRSRQGHAPREG